MIKRFPRARPGVLARAIVTAAALALAARPSLAQGNYEVQVYGSETMPKGVTMFELHSNFTLNGDRTGTRPSNHALHETVEITHGFNSWFEVGYYLFTSARSGTGLEFVGTHLRPRVRAPESWGWPVGVSISQEIGYQREIFTEDTWNYELRPIVDKSFGPLYLALNPVLETALTGPNRSSGFEFAPQASANLDVAPRLSLGAEYYGAFGRALHWDSPAEQEHMLFGALNYDFGPEWEFNFGVGRGLTGAGDRTLVKMIMGRRVGGVAP